MVGCRHVHIDMLGAPAASAGQDVRVLTRDPAKAGRFGPGARGFLAGLLLAECDDRARRRSERRIKAAAFPATSRCAYPGFMPFLRFFGQVGTLRMRPRRRAVVAGYLCGSVVDQCRRGWMPRCPMAWRCVNPGAGGSSGSSGGRALMTWGRCSGRVPRSASHRRRQLRASRATGAIARASRGAVASAASARLKGLLGMPSMRAPRMV